MFLYFLRYPFKTGAVCSSSKNLAYAMLENVGINEAKFIAEIGPGLGVFTREILKKKRHDCDFFALEINADFVKKLQEKFPKVPIYHQGADKVLEILQERGILKLDTIISGLPWSVFSSKEQDALLAKIYESLEVGGHFSTFAYIFPTPQAKRFRKKLFHLFSSVKVSKIIWKNFPPACVYSCQK